MNHLTSSQLQELVNGAGTNETELHVRACPACQSNVAAIRAIERTLRSLPLEQASPRLTGQVMERLGLPYRAPQVERAAQAGAQHAGSFSWMLLKNLAPVLALAIVAGIVIVALKLTGVWQETALQQTSALTQSVYDNVGSGLGNGVRAFNNWMAKNLSFAFAKNTSGITAFVLIFFGVIALLDKYILMPMMKRRLQ